MSTEPYPRPIRIGGLLRCTINTIRASAPHDPKPGDVIGCHHCSQSAVYRADAWEWNRPDPEAA